MKLDELYNEMLEIAKKIGITVRKDNGKFKGGTCIINDKDVIVINNSIPIEARTSMLAKCLSKYSINNVFMKPQLRDYIDNSTENKQDNEIQFIINTN